MVVVSNGPQIKGAERLFGQFSGYRANGDLGSLITASGHAHGGIIVPSDTSQMQAVTSQVMRAIERTQIERALNLGLIGGYALIGSTALAAYGVLRDRPIQDVDLAILPAPSGIGVFENFLGSSAKISIGDRGDSIKMRLAWKSDETRGWPKVELLRFPDCFDAILFPKKFEENPFPKSPLLQIGDHLIPVVSLSALIAVKIYSGHDGSKDEEDLMAIFRHYQPNAVDLEMLFRVAAQIYRDRKTTAFITEEVRCDLTGICVTPHRWHPPTPTPSETPHIHF